MPTHQGGRRDLSSEIQTITYDSSFNVSVPGVMPFMMVPHAPACTHTNRASTRAETLTCTHDGVSWPHTVEAGETVVFVVATDEESDARK